MFEYESYVGPVCPEVGEILNEKGKEGWIVHTVLPYDELLAELNADNQVVRSSVPRFMYFLQRPLPDPATAKVPFERQPIGGMVCK